MPKSLYEIHISFLAPEEAVVTAAGNNEDEVETTIRATLDGVQELKIISIKSLGEVPDQTDLNSAEASAPVDKNQIN